MTANQPTQSDIDMMLELTAIPTAAGREGRVVSFINDWLSERDDIKMDADQSGNLTISFKEPSDDTPSVYFTAHLDHPAFVVERIIAPATLELAFRGGVMDEYFTNARVEVFTADDRSLPGTIIEKTEPTSESPYKHYICELDDPCDDITTKDIARWLMPKPEVIDSVLHTVACDDLAAAACAMIAFDNIRAERKEGVHKSDVRLLFTRAEEVGFIGALAAVRHNTIPQNAKVIALENSRAFPEAPIGGGPIVRVGDRLTIFSPRLTDDIARIAETIAGGPATPKASQKQSDLPTWKWQRKLMAGGACEATVFCHAGLDATCVCLPLGNYHNMANLDEAQAGTLKEHNPGREYISLADAQGMIDLLTACGSQLACPPVSKTSKRLDDLWERLKNVLDEA
jgi:putative aminopeptidase FrvX